MSTMSPLASPTPVAGAVRRALAEAPTLLGPLDDRPRGAIVTQFARRARTPAANRSCRAARVLP